MKGAEQKLWLEKATARLKANQPLKAFFNRAKSKSQAKISFNEIVNASQGNFAFAQFLVRALIKNPQHFKEDLPQAEHYLKILKQKKAEQKHGLPDITKLGGISELAKLCEVFQKETETSHVITPERQACLDAGEAQIISVGKKFTTVLIKSARAAVAFEKGRLWCTSYIKSPNHFYNYASEGPVIDIIDNKTGLAAYGVALFSGHLNDAYNEEIKIENHLRKHPSFKKVLQPYINRIDQKPPTLQYLTSVQTSDMCERAVAANPRVLHYVRSDLKTKEMCEKAVEQDPHALGGVPYHLKTYELCLSAVSRDGYTLHHVPEHLKTQELCEKAVNQDGHALFNVPEEFKTREICLKAIMDEAATLRRVPAKFLDDELYSKVDLSNDEGIKFIPRKFKTKELYEKAVSLNGFALGIVPKKWRNEALCLTAVKNAGCSLQHAPSELRTEELCTTAVKQDGEALRYVPRKMWTEDLCALAAKGNAEILNHMPAKYWTAKVLFSAFQNLHAQRKNGRRLPFPELSYNGLDDFMKRIGIEFDDDGIMNWDNFTATLQDFEKQFPPKHAKNKSEPALAL